MHLVAAEHHPQIAAAGSVAGSAAEGCWYQTVTGMVGRRTDPVEEHWAQGMAGIA